MNTRLISGISAAALISVAAATSLIAHAHTVSDQHAIVTPADLTWEAGPVSLPAGIEYDVLYGDPATDGQFVMRLKMPDGYHIPPHTHPVLESVTVISGTFMLGSGTGDTKEAATTLPTGSYFGMPPGMVHYAYTEGQTVVQLNGMGPWRIIYVDPADDPRL